MISISNNNIDDQNNNFQLEDTGAGQRFSEQFYLLESYEAELIDLSAKLKPNSKP